MVNHNIILTFYKSKNVNNSQDSYWFLKDSIHMPSIEWRQGPWNLSQNQVTLHPVNVDSPPQGCNDINDWHLLCTKLYDFLHCLTAPLLDLFGMKPKI